MKLINQYNTPMGEMRHEVARERKEYREPVYYGSVVDGKLVFVSGWKEFIYSLTPTKKDYLAFAVGLGLLLAIAVFSLYLLL